VPISSFPFFPSSRYGHRDTYTEPYQRYQPQCLAQPSFKQALQALRTLQSPQRGSPTTIELRGTLGSATVCSIKNKYYKGATNYIRAVNIKRDGEQYGTYYQAVRSYREGEGGKVKQDVIHLGEHSTAEAALNTWPQELKELERIGRPRTAEKLQDKLDRLQELTEGD
jgi:hypothetical protein